MDERRAGETDMMNRHSRREADGAKRDSFTGFERLLTAVIAFFMGATLAVFGLMLFLLGARRLGADGESAGLTAFMLGLILVPASGFVTAAKALHVTSDSYLKKPETRARPIIVYGSLSSLWVPAVAVGLYLLARYW